MALIKCFISKNDDLGSFFLRLFMGLLFLYGGVGKLFGILGGPGIEMFSGMVWNQMWLAYLVAIVELLAGLMLIVGYMTRQASVLLSIILLVAIVHIHIPNDPNIMNTLVRLALIGGLMKIIFSGSGKVALEED
ncbi:MAG: DoxX family protein [Nanoarchaeota archaeon]|nr:DoxX family protein [Nanoarchaeota archaeon]